MENADAIIGGFKGFQRQFISNFYGGELQYAFKTKKSNILIAAGGNYEQQQILESIKQSPGSYNAIEYNFKIIANTISNAKFFNLSINANIKSGTANEYLQNLISVPNPTTGVNSQTWVTLFTYKNRYQNTNYSAQINFDIRDINELKNDYSWIVGFEATASGFNNEYHLPYSQFSSNRLNAAIYGQYRLFNKNNKRLTLKAKFDFGQGINNSLQLNEGSLISPNIGASTTTQGTYDVAKNVFIPDFYYFKANTYQATFETKYSFPLNFKKTKLLGYAKINYHYLGTNTNAKWSGVGMSIGIIP